MMIIDTFSAENSCMLIIGNLRYIGNLKKCLLFWGLYKYKKYGCALDLDWCPI